MFLSSSTILDQKSIEGFHALKMGSWLRGVGSVVPGILSTVIIEGVSALVAQLDRNRYCSLLC